MRTGLITDGPTDRGLALINEIRALRIGGPFWLEPPKDLGCGLRLLVLPDRAERAARLIQAACATGPAQHILAVANPCDADLVRRQDCRVVPGPVDLWPLLEQAEELHVWDDDPLGLLGLAAGLPVFRHRPDGPVDRIGAEAAATRAQEILIDATRYIDPFNNRPTDCETIIGILGDWRRMIERNRRIGCVVGIGRWKRRAVAGLLHDGERAPIFAEKAEPAIKAAAATGRGIAGWPSTMPPGLTRACAAASVPVHLVEDGFLRSIGLGVDAVPPCSVVIDDQGIYFDPSRPSRLERLLETTTFSPSLLDRGRRLREALVAARITKYNTGKTGPSLAPTGGRRRILVPGQVADDLSVQLGGGTIRGNLALIARVRAENPDAFILYKPHPDVDAGHRLGVVPDREVLLHADQILRDIAIPSLLDEIDEVHTLTSLAGFEALLRGRKVVTHGQPFYAGWGLTEDHAPVTRRTRRLEIDALVAGALILYPQYLDPVTFLPCPVEILVARLADPRFWRPGVLVRFRRIFGRIRGHLGLKRPAVPEQR